MAKQQQQQKLEDLCWSVTEFGRMLGIGKNSSYEAAARGDFPILKFGKLLRVPKVAGMRMLEQAGIKPSKK